MEQFTVCPQNTTLPAAHAARKAYHRAGLGMFLFILVPQFSSVFFTLTAIIAFPAFYSSPWFLWFNQIFSLYMLGAPLALLAIGLPPAGQESNIPGEKFPFRRFLLFFCCMETIAVAGSLISQALMSMASAITGREYTSPVDEALDGAPWWILLLVVGIIGPIIEELLCRRAVMRRLLPFGEKSAIMFSALLFGLMHGNLYQLFYAVGLGLLLGYVYARTRKLLYPCLLHICFNSLSCLQATLLAGLDVDSMPGIEAALGEQLAWLQSHWLPYLGTMLYALLVYGAAIAGFVLMLVFFHRIHFSTCPLPLEKGKRASVWFGNVGMPLFFVTSFALIGLTLLTL